jgi:hypothetical protein
MVMGIWQCEDGRSFRQVILEFELTPLSAKHGTATFAAYDL